MNEPTAAPRTYVLGDEFHLPKVHVPKKKAAPIFTEERRSAQGHDPRRGPRTDPGRGAEGCGRGAGGVRAEGGDEKADPKADRYLQDGRAGAYRSACDDAAGQSYLMVRTPRQHPARSVRDLWTCA